MGTHCLTVVQEEWNKRSLDILVMYRQYDGYPTGHGDELAAFLKPFTIVNGLRGSKGQPEAIANGMGCLAAQIVAHFKKVPGELYLYPSGTRGCGEEYIYTISLQSGSFLFPSLSIEVYDTSSRKTIFNGPPKDFKGDELEN